jgi:hypothetical protein
MSVFLCLCFCFSYFILNLFFFCLLSEIWLVLHGVESNAGVAVLGSRLRPSMVEEFLHTYHVMSVSGLNLLAEDATFVVTATIIGLVEGEEWWYPACNFHKSITPDFGAYYCCRCVNHVFQLILRFGLFFGLCVLLYILL